MGKVTILIDAEYVLQGLRAIQNKPKSKQIKKENLNWKEFVDYLAQKRTIKNIIYFTARLDAKENKETYDEQTVFLDNLKETLKEYPFELHLGKLIKVRQKAFSTWNEDRGNKTDNHTWVQKGIDSSIVFNLCKFAYTADKDDVIVLVAGDDDFTEVLDFLDNQKLKKEVYAMDRKDSHLTGTFKKHLTKMLDYSLLEKEHIL